MCTSHSATFRVLSEEIVLQVTCRFTVSLGGGEFRIFLHLHLEPKAYIHCLFLCLFIVEPLKFPFFSSSVSWKSLETVISHQSWAHLVYRVWLFFIYLFLNIYFLLLFIFWLRWSLLQCAGFPLRWLLLLRSMDSRCTGLSSCGTQAQ